MNDIERMAVVIKGRRSKAASDGSSTQSQKPSADIELPNIGIVGTVVSVQDNAEAQSGVSNDTLVNDIASDFGVSVTSESRSEPYTSTTPCMARPFFDIQIERLAEEGFITPATGRGLLTEQYRRIKRPLLKNLERQTRSDVNSNVIMVTSSVAGEGKTYTAINLAMSLALERERTVLLIDADVLKNSASGVLEVGVDTQGLTDLLVGDVEDPSQVIMQTNISNFNYMPSGTPQQHTNELLSSARMKRLVDDLSSQFQDRIIILDCPPLLQTNEATVITDYAGQVVFVVAEEDTSQSYVVEAMKQIPEDRYVGIVLNKSRKRILGNDYGYTYDYG